VRPENSHDSGDDANGGGGESASARASVSGATGEVFNAVYDELRELAHAKMTRERPGQTLQTTALVHEAYLRLSRDGDVRWENRGHFFTAAAEAMRRILVERARRLAATKRGGAGIGTASQGFREIASASADGNVAAGGAAFRKRVNLEFVNAASVPVDPSAMLALDEALDELRRLDDRLSQVVMLRYFAGLSVEETAAATGSSPRTVKRDWAAARAWLARRLGDGDE
jgi:RNA polymerase sigma factor (TIGR02999 family)